MDFYAGQQISIFLGGAISHSAIGTTFIHGSIDVVTEKAIKVKNENGSIWFPKRAIVKGGEHYVKLAKWFKFDYKSRYVVERMSNVGGISASQEVEAEERRTALPAMTDKRIEDYLG